MTGAYIRAVTGPSHLTPRQRVFVAATLEDLSYPPPTEFRSGAADGVDTIAAYRALELWPEIAHTLYVPDGHHNFHLSEHWEHDRVYVPAGHDPAESYRLRNAAMVAGASELLAFLFRPTFYRSGEWMTVGIAGRAGVRVVKVILPPRTET